MDNFLPIELVHYILSTNLDYKNVLKCKLTSGIFNVLHERELRLLKNINKGYIHCIKVGDLQALQKCQIDYNNAF